MLLRLIVLSWGSIMYSPYKIKKTHIFWIFVLIFVFWALFLNHIKQIERDEVIYLLIESNFANEEKLEDDLISLLSDQGIRKINMTIISEDSPYYGQTILTSGLFEADILILNGAFISAFDLSGTFRALNDFYDSPTMDHDHFIIQDGVIYGIKVSTQFLSSYQIIYDDDLYVFFNASSIYSSEMLYKTIPLFIESL